jgi:hypothetical protein
VILIFKQILPHVINEMCIAITFFKKKKVQLQIRKYQRNIPPRCPTARCAPVSVNQRNSADLRPRMGVSRLSPKVLDTMPLRRAMPSNKSRTHLHRSTAGYQTRIICLLTRTNHQPRRCKGSASARRRTGDTTESGT